MAETGASSNVARHFPNGREPLTEDEVGKLKAAAEEVIRAKLRAADLFLQSEMLRAQAVRLVHDVARRQEDLVQETARLHGVPLDESTIRPNVRWEVDLDEGCFVRHVDNSTLSRLKNKS